MLILLPPSETKAPGGTGATLDFGALSFPSLNPARQEIAQALASLEVDEAMIQLKLSEKLRGEAEANQVIYSSPTLPAIERYTGVLYDALDAATLSDAARSHLAIGSALFGIVRADDLIPHYRLSGGTKLSGNTMKSWWGKAITEALEEVAAHELVVDMRSGTYQQLGKLKTAATVRVESVQPDGSRKVISHFNKHYKGLLARHVLSQPVLPTTFEEFSAAAASFPEWETEIRGSERAPELVLVLDS